jgi:hypothetical protein
MVVCVMGEAMGRQGTQRQTGRESWRPRLGSGELTAVFMAGLAALIAGGLGLANTLRMPIGLKVALISIGAVIAATTPALKLRNDRWARRQIWEALLALPVSKPGILPRVADVSPYEIGVSLSKYASKPTDRPPYWPREVDGQLRWALERERFVLLVGDSKAGKSRTAFEAAAEVLGDCDLLVPKGDPGTLGKLFALDNSVQPHRPMLLWLDDLERYLDSGGLDLTLLNALAERQPPVVILATITSRRRNDLLDTPGEASRVAKLVLQKASVIQLSSRPSSSELQAVPDLYAHEDVGNGIGETLVAAPELLRKYLDGADSHPAGRALVEAAVDWRRTGLNQPIPESALRRLAGFYFAKLRSNQELTDEAINGGLT